MSSLSIPAHVFSEKECGVKRRASCTAFLYTESKLGFLQRHKAYWPFHWQECTRNEFADVVEEREPKFAAWMRKHGKQAVLKDDEVDRLERASKASSGYTREEVMDSMYGRLLPKPIGLANAQKASVAPSYTAEERIKMAAIEERKKATVKAISDRDRAWKAVEVNPEFGMDCGSYKWTQNQSCLEVFCRVPDNVPFKEVEVVLRPTHIRVAVAARPILLGDLFAAIKAEDSIWTLEGGVLSIELLKLNRRGHYADGKSNADTFWPAVLRAAPPDESLQARAFIALQLQKASADALCS